MSDSGGRGESESHISFNQGLEGVFFPWDCSLGCFATGDDYTRERGGGVKEGVIYGDVAILTISVGSLSATGRT